jgi:hypothetical protein
MGDGVDRLEVHHEDRFFDRRQATTVGRRPGHVNRDWAKADDGTQDAAAAPSSGSITRWPEEVWNSLIASESRWRYFESAR